MHQKSELSQRAAAPTHMFDNNQPTMVRESQMAVHDQQASARQLREMDVNAIVSTSKKKSRQQPPPASRHRSVKKKTSTTTKQTKETTTTNHNLATL
jgi:hypothetical protein